MINLKNVVLASLFVASSALAQDGGVKGLLTNDASIGLNLGALTYVSADSNIELGFGLNYTKQINAVIAVQGGFLSAGLSNATDTMSLFCFNA